MTRSRTPWSWRRPRQTRSRSRSLPLPFSLCEGERVPFRGGLLAWSPALFFANRGSRRLPGLATLWRAERRRFGLWMLRYLSGFVGKLRRGCSPRSKVLNQVSVEVDRLLPSVPYEGPLALPALDAHRARQHKAESPRGALGIGREKTLRPVLSIAEKARGGPLGVDKTSLDDKPLGRFLQLAENPLHAGKRLALPGASTETLVVTRRVRRSASTLSGPTAPGTLIDA